MRGTFQIATLANTKLYIHWSFLLAFALAPAVAILSGGSGLQAALMVAAVAGLAGVHELGHVWTARQFEIRARSVTVFPFAALAGLLVWLEADDELGRAELRRGAFSRLEPYLELFEWPLLLPWTRGRIGR